VFNQKTEDSKRKGMMNLPPGFRVHIDEANHFGVHATRYMGVGNLTDPVCCDCPNCCNPLFPALNFQFPDAVLSRVIDWNHPWLHIVFCPFCALYMAPYWIRHIDQAVEIVGGFRDGGDILTNIELPYACREISLAPLVDEDYPIDEAKLHELRARRHGDGVYHQIGGVPIKGQGDSMSCCDCGEPMRFAGILDSDDLHAPLYEENHSPVALIIGDADSLNIFSCVTCSVVGVRWAR
jgi:hypothetical protein